MKTIKCPSCAYEWIARVENPKLCPNCKVRLKGEQSNEGEVCATSSPELPASNSSEEKEK